MQIISLTSQTGQYNQQAAFLLRQAFPDSYMDCAEEEIEKCLQKEKILLGAIEKDRLLGFVGAIPQYGVTAWELHPLIVDETYRGQRIGTFLIGELEKQLKKKGCLTIYLGSDDENSSTTLSDTDLFEDTFEKITTIKNLKHHPYEFYQKVGYKIVGVIPDANGIGKPDIWLAKHI